MAKMRDACAREGIEFRLGSPYKTRIIRMTANRTTRATPKRSRTCSGAAPFRRAARAARRPSR